jgi:hypothetical protein
MLRDTFARFLDSIAEAQMAARLLGMLPAA